ARDVLSARPGRDAENSDDGQCLVHDWCLLPGFSPSRNYSPTMNHLRHPSREGANFRYSFPTMPTGPATTIVRRGERAVAVELRGCTLTVVAGPDAGKSAQLSRRSLVVGSHPPSDLILTDPHVSRQHLRIDVENEFVLRDLGSTNGTRLGG